MPNEQNNQGLAAALISVLTLCAAGCVTTLTEEEKVGRGFTYQDEKQQRKKRKPRDLWTELVELEDFDNLRGLVGQAFGFKTIQEFHDIIKNHISVDLEKWKFLFEFESLIPHKIFLIKRIV